MDVTPPDQTQCGHLSNDTCINSATNSNTTVSENGSDIQVVEQHDLINKVLEQYTLPVICLFGIIGNSLASIVFLQKALRQSSCSIFLAARGISDNGFLATLLLIWISSTFDLQLSQIRGICQILVFFTYVCGCISVWLVVFVTAENYIRICKPFIVNRVCKTTTAKITVFVLCVLVLCLYNFPFWVTNADCSPRRNHYDTIQAMVYTDTLLTLVIPTLCITVLMIVVVYNVIKSYNRRGRFNSSTVKHSNNPMAKVTKMLFAVTLTFFCLNLPAHVIRLRLMIGSFLKGTADVSPLEAIVQKIALFIYYLSLSINVIVYFNFGSKFRIVFKQTFSCYTCRESNSSSINKHSSMQCMVSKKDVTVVYDKESNILSEMDPLNEKPQT